MNAALSATFAFYLLSSVPAAAQPPDAPVPLGVRLAASPLGDLPSTDNVYSVLDTAVPEVIADRIDTGGLSTGDPSRIGAHGSSWTQTLFQIGDVDITDPLGSGTPLLLPRTTMWEDVEVATGLMPIDQNAPGLAIRLIPRRRAADRWHRLATVSGSWPGLLAGRADANPVPVARLHTWLDSEVTLSGPMAPAAGLFWTTSATSGSRFERGSPDLVSANVVSSFAHLQLTASRANLVSVVGWAERAQDPAQNRVAFAQPFGHDRSNGAHAQVTWSHARSAWTWSFFSGLTRADRSNDLAPRSTLTVERLRDGPVPELVNRGSAATRVWMTGVRGTATTSRHRAIFGGDLSLHHASTRPGFAGDIYETLDGIPANIWSFAPAVGPSSWASANLSAFAGDQIDVRRRLTVDGGVRLEHIAGTNTTGATVVSWNSLLPRGSARWQIIDFANITAFGGYGRYADQLLLSDLGWGDPTSPVGTVSAWTPAGAGALIARVGPGTGGNPTFSAIDPALRRPYLDEIVTGFDGRPTPASFGRVAAIGRRERNLIGAMDVGVPTSAYTVSYIFDKGVDLAGSQTNELLPVYDRPPSTFGADRYLLTNPQDDQATFVGVDLLYQWQSDRLLLLMGATAGRSEGISANRGFNALENDATVIGEVFIDPNARTFAQGRLFTERGYTVKWSGTYQLSHDATAAVVARYQDGEHFARLVIVPDLDQGPEAIRAFRNGRTRFTYTMTIDVRLQKRFTVGGRALTAVIDGFNLLNKAKEVEEFPVTGPLSRLTAAVQPPRAVHVGARIAF